MAAFVGQHEDRLSRRQQVHDPGQLSEDIVDAFSGGCRDGAGALPGGRGSARGPQPDRDRATARISRAWLYQLLARYDAGGYHALEPRSRRPHSSPGRTTAEVETAILELRAELLEAGHDAGPATIAHHLAQRLGAGPSTATVWRILRRHAEGRLYMDEFVAAVLGRCGPEGPGEESTFRVASRAMRSHR